jgi:hypothetical protein
MNLRHCLFLFSLALVSIGAQANAPESMALGDPSAPSRSASWSIDTSPPTTKARTNQDIDAALDDLDLLHPDITPDQALELLGDMLPGWDGAAPKGGPSSVGYVAHRKWAQTGYGLDQFSGSSSGIFRARTALRLDNGDVVVAGDIQGSGVSTARGLGIVKYNSRGQRVTWTSVSSDFGLYFNQYIRFPGNDSWGTSRQVIAVHDIAARNDQFYVLITYLEGGLRRPAIIRFNENGAYGGWWFAAPDGAAVRDAVAMDVFGNHMVILGRRTHTVEEADGGFWTARATINANGTLTIGAITTLRQGVQMTPADIAFARPGVLVPITAPAYYVVNTVHTGAAGSTATWPCIHRITSGNVLDTGFNNGSSFRCNPFNIPAASDIRDWATAVHTRTETAFNGGNPIQREVLFMSTIFDKDPTDGIGLVKLVGGSPDTTFGGSQGQVEHGGCSGTTGPGCSAIGALPDTAHIPLRGALFADSNGVYVAGRTFRRGILVGSVPSRRPMFMQVHPGNGSLTSLQVFGTLPNSRFTDIVPGNTGSGGVREFTMVGFAHHEDTTNLDDGPTRFMTAHLVRDSDLIFYDGLQ